MRLLILIPLIISSFLFGQEKNEDHSRHLVGFNANTISGVGPSYRFSYKGFSTQATFSGYKTGSRIKYNIGISVMHRFEEFEQGKIDFGLSCRLKKLRDEYFEPIDEQLIREENWSTQLNAGFHFDYYRRFGKRIRLILSLGYGIYNIYGTVVRSDSTPYYQDNSLERLIDFRLKNLGTFPTIGIALYYKLN